MALNPFKAKILAAAARVGKGAGAAYEAEGAVHNAAQGVAGTFQTAVGFENRMRRGKVWLDRLRRHPALASSVLAKRGGRVLKAHPVATAVTAATVGQSIYQDVREHRTAVAVERIRKKLGA